MLLVQEKNSRLYQDSNLGLQFYPWRSNQLFVWVTQLVRAPAGNAVDPGLEGLFFVWALILAICSLHFFIFIPWRYNLMGSWPPGNHWPHVQRGKHPAAAYWDYMCSTPRFPQPLLVFITVAIKITIMLGWHRYYSVPKNSSSVEFRTSIPIAELTWGRKTYFVLHYISITFN